jgi:hypothetical protein
MNEQSRINQKRLHSEERKEELQEPPKQWQDSKEQEEAKAPEVISKKVLNLTLTHLGRGREAKDARALADRSVFSAVK